MAFTCMSQWMTITWTYMRLRALRASLCCNLRFSSVSLRTLSSAAQRSQLPKNTHIKKKNERNENHAHLHGVIVLFYSYYSVFAAQEYEYDLQELLQWVWYKLAGCWGKRKPNKWYLLFHPLKWIRYFGVLLPCSSVPIKTSMTCNVNIQRCFQFIRLQDSTCMQEL